MAVERTALLMDFSDMGGTDAATWVLYKNTVFFASAVFPHIRTAPVSRQDMSNLCRIYDPGRIVA